MNFTILNKCGVISPRFDVQFKDLEQWQNNLLAAHQFGFIVLTDSAGMVDLEEARQNYTKGKILGFFSYEYNMYIQIKHLSGETLCMGGF